MWQYCVTYSNDIVHMAWLCMLSCRLSRASLNGCGANLHMTLQYMPSQCIAALNGDSLPLSP